EVEALPRRRAAVDEAAASPAGARLEDEDEPAAAHRDGLLGELVPVAGHEVAQLAVELVPDAADLAAEGGETRARVLPHLAAAVERPVDPPEELREVGEGAGEAP